MKIVAICLAMFCIVTTSCSQSSHSGVYKIHELCRKDKSEAMVVNKMKPLGIDLNIKGSRFYQPESRTDHSSVAILLNPQPTYTNIQGVSVSWKDSSELKYEEIQNILGITLPDRGSKKIVADQGLDHATRYYVLGYRIDSEPLPINQVTITCNKNNYDVCWKATFSCHEYIHPESD